MGSKYSVVSEHLPCDWLLSTRLRPIFLFSFPHVLIFDFFNNKLFSIDEYYLPKNFRGMNWNEVEFSRLDDKITVNAKNAGDVPGSLVIDLGTGCAKEIYRLRKRKKDDNKRQICKSFISNIGYKSEWYENIDTASELSLRLTSIKNGVMTIETKIQIGGNPHLLRLHPRTHDLNGFYCLKYIDRLRFGSFQGGDFFAEEIVCPLFENIRRYYLTEDNVLMLFILIENVQKIMFIDCNEVKILSCIQLRENINLTREWQCIITELTANRKDYLTLRTRFVSLIINHFPNVLAEEIFCYLWGVGPIEENIGVALDSE